MRRGAPLSPQDSAALQAVFQATNLAHVQVTCSCQLHGLGENCSCVARTVAHGCSASLLQDILLSAALAECSYKPVDHPPEEALRLTREILAVC